MLPSNWKRRVPPRRLLSDKKCGVFLCRCHLVPYLQLQPHFTVSQGKEVFSIMEDHQWLTYLRDTDRLSNIYTFVSSYGVLADAVILGLNHRVFPFG